MSDFKDLLKPTPISGWGQQPIGMSTSNGHCPAIKDTQDQAGQRVQAFMDRKAGEMWDRFIAYRSTVLGVEVVNLVGGARALRAEFIAAQRQGGKA